MAVCGNCTAKIKFLGDDICIRCGSPFKIPVSDKRADAGFDKNISKAKICSLCKNEKYFFYSARSFTIYKKEIAEIIHKYKYKKLYYLYEVLLYFLKTAYKFYYYDKKIDFIETVPGYAANNAYADMAPEKSHMQLIAQRLSACLKIPYGDNVIKLRRTLKQQKLDRDLRKVNLTGTFKARNNIKSYGKNILIIDDVWTTGSTLNEISRAFKKAGAEKIYLLTVARGA